ncbi:hypothetical protein [Salegentibacter mishustinae]|jgi:hypothetical protein|uniref:hypothetical protein n=1 Tax=Salegentibacter mishustinae TaxID=270918 RepID=UPI00248FEB9F|nr:hypothetical protein [Salegentibacter mishustinae]|tara:strand:- start:548 stop:748 length:201 start_codon:yes stop_codon:yes gene_type:complete
MNKLTRTKTLLLISSGIFIIAIAGLANHFLNISETYDFALGLTNGLGFGLMVIALIKGNLKKQISN